LNRRLLKSPLTGIINNRPNRKKRYTLLFFLVLINSVDLQAQDRPTEFNRARDYYLQKQFQEAVSVLDKIIKMNSTKYDLSRAYTLRGLSYKQMNRLNDAVMDFNQAIEFDPQNCRAYSNRGVIEFYRGDFKGALADFNRGIEIDPQACPAYFDRGRLKETIGDYQGALEDLEKAYRLTPEDKLARQIENLKAKLTPSRTGGTTSGVDKRPAPLKDLPLPPPPPLR
jgi:tetratricopeptide (TPR) repeat protein